MIQDAIDHNEKLSSKDQNLLKACYKHLENRGSLGPEVELFYRDLSMKLLKIPVINHCKSSIDRTTLALAIATSTQSWINLGKKIPVATPHEIMSDPLYKELFIANVQGSHQATRASRASEGKINGHQQFSRALGFEWGSKGEGLKGKVVSLLQGQSPIALRLLPDRYLDESNKNFNEESPLIKDRFLKKPKKMKMFYQNDNPHIVKLQEDLRHEAEERQEFRTQRVFNTLMRRVAQAA
ncbi:MAG: hypothetical protein HRU43_07765 [Simkaniaceae bacterium]|nr:hypothetical protein [Simkaniaceae bacterium]